MEAGFRERVAFFGTPDFAVPTLHRLLHGPDRVVGVVCQPDRPAGRGRRLAAPPTKGLALRHGVAVLQPDRVRDPAFAETLRGWAPDLVVVAAYGKILPPEILAIPPGGCWNVHASLLPRYRGAAPIQWAILNGESQTGVTIMEMNEAMDAGDVLLQRSTPIGPDETAAELGARLAVLGADLLLEALARRQAGTLGRMPQDERQATFAPLLRKEHGRIDWTRPAEEIVRRVRAFNPWPGAYTQAADVRVTVHRARVVGGEEPSAPPGTVTRADRVVWVAAGRGVVELQEIQRAGGRRLPAAAAARGGLVRVGMRLGESG